MRAKEAGTSEAPPTSAPSISGLRSSASTESGVTEPPYKMRTEDATSSPYAVRSQERISACTDWAISGVAVLPVPIAHT
jgi:hypothetical protein